MTSNSFLILGLQLIIEILDCSSPAYSLNSHSRTVNHFHLAKIENESPACRVLLIKFPELMPDFKIKFSGDSNSHFVLIYMCFK